eukprot:scaffold160452_cov19-Prasinocladus_malaysianus.AAC.1
MKRDLKRVVCLKSVAVGDSAHSSAGCGALAGTQEGIVPRYLGRLPLAYEYGIREAIRPGAITPARRSTCSDYLTTASQAGGVIPREFAACSTVQSEPRVDRSILTSNPSSGRLLSLATRTT